MKKTLAICSASLFACSLTFGGKAEKKNNTFNHAEYMQATAAGQKKAAPSVKGALCFDAEKRCVDFVDEKGAPAFSIKYDSIKNILYEQTSKPRYAEAILISPLFIFAHSKKHFLTIQYSDAAGRGSLSSFTWTKRTPARQSL